MVTRIKTAKSGNSTPRIYPDWLVTANPSTAGLGWSPCVTGFELSEPEGGILSGFSSLLTFQVINGCVSFSHHPTVYATLGADNSNFHKTPPFRTQSLNSGHKDTIPDTKSQFRIEDLLNNWDLEQFCREWLIPFLIVYPFVVNNRACSPCLLLLSVSALLASVSALLSGYHSRYHLSGYHSRYHLSGYHSRYHLSGYHSR